MSAALLKKSLEIVENATPKKNFSRKKGRNIIPEAHKLTRVVKKKGKTYKQNQLEGSSRKITIKDVQKHMEGSKERMEKTVDKLLKLHSCPLEGEETEEIARRAKSGHHVLPPRQEVVEADSVFTEEDFRKFEEEYFEETI